MVPKPSRYPEVQCQLGLGLHPSSHLTTLNAMCAIYDLSDLRAVPFPVVFMPE